MVTNNEIILWAQLAESLNGQTGLPAYVLFGKINDEYKVNRDILDRLNYIMKENTNMSVNEINTFINAAKMYCLKY